MDHVSHHGRTTAYRVDREDRSGLPVLLVHGSGADSSVWGPYRRIVDRPAVQVDLSGHGESDDVAAEPGYETLAAYADDVLAVVDETSPGVVIGHSLGGAVVLSLAIDRGFSPRGIVLAGTGARLAVLDDLLEWLETDFERALEFLHRPDRLFHDADDRTLARSRELMSTVGRRVTARDFRTCDAFDVRDDLGAIDVPALALVGRHDRLTPPRFHEFLADELPDCQFALVEDAAHAAMLEQPRAFSTAVERFLARL